MTEFVELSRACDMCVEEAVVVRLHGVVANIKVIEDFAKLVEERIGPYHIRFSYADKRWRATFTPAPPNELELPQLGLGDASLIYLMQVLINAAGDEVAIAKRKQAAKLG